MVGSDFNFYHYQLRDYAIGDLVSLMVDILLWIKKKR
jgi:hypothetical protein